jgi:hypothetical protein
VLDWAWLHAVTHTLCAHAVYAVQLTFVFFMPWLDYEVHLSQGVDLESEWGC